MMTRTFLHNFSILCCSLLLQIRVAESFHNNLPLFTFNKNKNPVALRTATRTKSSPKKLKSQASASSESSSVASSGSATVVPTTVPLRPDSFAGMVEQGIRDRYPDDNTVHRVIDSWRLLEMDYEHKQEFDSGDSEMDETELDDDDDDDKRNYQQIAHSYVPGLTVRPFWDTRAAADKQQFAWVDRLRSCYPAIKKEFEAYLKHQDMAERLEKEGNNVWAGALTEEATSYGVGWKTLVLMNRGRWDEANARLFPVTSRAIQYDAQVPAVEVFFARMDPHSRIRTHSDGTNFVLTSHLAIDIPYSGTGQCRLTVGPTTREWINGDVMLFDTSVTHRAVNDADQPRYILMMRVWHHELTDTERRALQFTFDCLDVPELVASESAQERYLADQQVEAMRAFPEDIAYTTSSAKAQGFGGGGGGGRNKKKKGKRKHRGVSSGGRGFS